MNGSLAPGGFLMLRSDHGRNASQSFGCEERVHAIILQFFFFSFSFSPNWLWNVHFRSKAVSCSYYRKKDAIA